MSERRTLASAIDDVLEEIGEAIPTTAWIDGDDHNLDEGIEARERLAALRPLLAAYIDAVENLEWCDDHADAACVHWCFKCMSEVESERAFTEARRALGWDMGLVYLSDEDTIR